MKIIVQGAIKTDTFILVLLLTFHSKYTISHDERKRMAPGLIRNAPYIVKSSRITIESMLTLTF